MAKKNKGLIIFLIILIVGGVYLYKKEARTEVGTQEQCEFQLSNNDCNICSPCKEITSGVISCSNGYFDSGDLGRWTFYYNCDGSCDDLSDSSKQRIKCLEEQGSGCIEDNECTSLGTDCCSGNYRIDNSGSCSSNKRCGILPCSGSSTQSCTTSDNCAGTQARTCNSGTWSEWGVCSKNDANCGNGICTPSNNQQEKKCDGNAVYWYDNCGNKKDLVKSCSSTETCKNGECTTTTKKCPDGSTPEIWQDVNKQCKTKSLVWIVGGVLGFMFLMMMMSGMKK